MTMVNVSGIVFFYVLVATGFYGLLSAGFWIAGDLAGSPATLGFGSDLMAGTVGSFVGYTFLMLVWLGFVPEGGLLVFVLFLAVPIILFFPPIWAVRSFFLDD